MCELSLGRQALYHERHGALGGRRRCPRPKEVRKKEYENRGQSYGHEKRPEVEVVCFGARFLCLRAEFFQSDHDPFL